jgi:hypothetical protein
VSEPRRPVDHWLDLVVYLPVGAAVTCFERARTRVRVARLVGQFATQQVQREASRYIDEQQRRMRRPAPAAAAPRPAPAAAMPAREPVAEPSEPPAPGPVPTAAALSIVGYDALAASQIVARLDGLTAAERAAVRAHESAHRRRRTILAKLDHLDALG